MPVACPNCQFDNLDSAEFCEACGSELGGVATSPFPTPFPPPPSTPYPEPTSEPSVTPSSPTLVTPGSAATTARLICKQSGAPTSEFQLDGGNLIIGKFDPDQGPVDIDLEGFPGDETISRNHAEIYTEGGLWKIKDLGSTNGIFMKPFGQNRFGARITVPEILNSGDEISIAKIRFLFQSP